MENTEDHLDGEVAGHGGRGHLVLDHGAVAYADFRLPLDPRPVPPAIRRQRESLAGTGVGNGPAAANLGTDVAGATSARIFELELLVAQQATMVERLHARVAEMGRELGQYWPSHDDGLGPAPPARGGRTLVRRRRLLARPTFPTTLAAAADRPPADEQPLAS